MHDAQNSNVQFYCPIHQTVLSQFDAAGRCRPGCSYAFTFHDSFFDFLPDSGETIWSEIRKKKGGCAKRLLDAFLSHVVNHLFCIKAVRRSVALGNLTRIAEVGCGEGKT